jgi:hypothetical protein
MRGYELSDFALGVIARCCPNKLCRMTRADDRRMLSGISSGLQTGAPCLALPKEFGSQTIAATAVCGRPRGGHIV